MFSEYGVILAPHGAGLMNLMFSRPFSAVVEVFPYQTHHNLYPGIAHMVGVEHYPVHTYNGTSVLSSEKVRCLSVTVLRVRLFEAATASIGTVLTAH